MQQKSNRYRSLPYLLFLRVVEVFRICAHCTILSRPSTCIWVITEILSYRRHYHISHQLQIFVPMTSLFYLGVNSNSVRRMHLNLAMESKKSSTNWYKSMPIFNINFLSWVWAYEGNTWARLFMTFSVRCHDKWDIANYEQRHSSECRHLHREHFSHPINCLPASNFLSGKICSTNRETSTKYVQITV